MQVLHALQAHARKTSPLVRSRPILATPQLGFAQLRISSQGLLSLFAIQVSSAIDKVPTDFQGI
jgi:hypothetical protein